MGSSFTVPVSCNKDCGAGCPLVAHVENNRIVRISDNPLGSPYMRGCARGFQSMRSLDHSDRILRPLMRSGPKGSGSFRAVSWGQALDFTAEKLQDLKHRFGSESILHLGGSGSCRGAFHHTGSLPRRFLNLFGGPTRTYSSYSSAASSFVNPYVFGTGFVGMDAATLEHSNMIILWGANLMDTRFGCEFPARLREAGRSGTPIVVIDPRKSRTAELPGARWIPIRPGTDTAMMAAVMHELLEHHLVDRQFLSEHCIGFDNIENYIRGTLDGQPKTAVWAEAVCGVPANTIKNLAEEYGVSKPAALIPGLSIQRNIGGEEAMRMAMTLQAATGNIGILGGSSGGCTWGTLPGPFCGKLETMDHINGPAIPVASWSDAILEGRAGGYPTDIRGIYNVGGNYLSQGSDIPKNVRAFESVEFSVCHEHFLTPTAAYCDVVFPATMPLEREDILFPGINYLFYSAQAVDPPIGVKDDFEILRELADRLGFEPEFSLGMDPSGWIEKLLAESEIADIDDFKRTGIYAGAEQNRVGLSEFIEDPHGNPLNTPSGKIELSSTAYAETGFSAEPRYRGMAEEKDFTLRMVTPHALYLVNSTNSNISWFREREEQVLWMHPQDAAERSIVGGEDAVVLNSIGSTTVPVMVTDKIMKGVVCLAQGAWPRLDAEGSDHAGAANMLTSTTPTEPSMGSRTHSVWVQVKAHSL